MVLKKLDELEIDVNLKQIICDFELNIHKAIDGILPWVEILGCGNLFQNEKDVVDHKLLMHTRIQTNKRIIQNLKDIDFNEDWDEDKDYKPNEKEIESTTENSKIRKKYLEWFHLR